MLIRHPWIGYRSTHQFAPPPSDPRRSERRPGDLSSGRTVWRSPDGKSTLVLEGEPFADRPYLTLDDVDVIHVGDQTFPLAEGIRAVAMSRLHEDVAP